MTPAAIAPRAAASPTTTVPEATTSHPPVPVPQPAVPRQRLHLALQRVWADVEAAVAVRPPLPPEQSDATTLRGWAEGPFTQWLGLRQKAVSQVEMDADWLMRAEKHEKVVAAALLGYLYEDTASAIRGAPVPAHIAGDAELLGIYQETLQKLLQPLARRAARAYAGCLQARYPVRNAEEIDAASLAADPWREWLLYCDQHGEDTVRVFKLP